MCPFLVSSSLGFSMNTNRLPSDISKERKIRFEIDPFTKSQTHLKKKAHPYSIYTRLNTRYVIPLFSCTDTLFEWSQMKIIKLEFPIFFVQNNSLCLKQVYCCLTFLCLCVCIKILRKWITCVYKPCIFLIFVTGTIHGQSELDCDFDSGLCSWTQVTGSDQYDWTRHNGSTSTSGTGPTGDHTTGRTSVC